MSNNQPSGEIIVFALPDAATEAGDYDQVRGGYDEVRGWFDRPKPTTVSVTNLHQQINVFLTNMEAALKETPKEVGGFQLSEIEITAGIMAGGEIALVGFGVKGEISGGLRFVLKRSE